MAQLLHHQGVFNKRFLCADCDKSPELKKARGCGVPPIGNTAWEFGVSKPTPWTPEKSKAQVEEIGQTWTVTHAQREFGAATFGWINELDDWLIGDVWPWCPRWFQELAPGELRAYGNLVIGGIRAKNYKIFDSWVGDSEPTLDLIEDIIKFSGVAAFIEVKQRDQDKQ